ncbi:MAG TPA: sigma-70 family RNA polymerase sigma factor [Candidatus Polarisedimenticolia bacterium]|nr:sigma-70 family RNA polymerase sigma factor [Candidatus Polarisedimenticolia bacterium]
MERMTTDDAILNGFLAGEEEAIHHVQGWVDGVVHLGRWRFEDPEAVGQEIVMRLLGIVRSGRYQKRSTFKTFVFAVAKYTCVDLFRRERQRTRVETVAGAPLAGVDAGPPPDHPHRALQEREDLELLKYILQGLPEECRRLWGWVYGEGLSAAEVGSRLGTNAGTVRVRVHRCLQKARDFVRQYGGGVGLLPGDVER